jgi:biotin carboxyl carrier protein
MTTETMRSDISRAEWKSVAQAAVVPHAGDTLTIIESMKMEILTVAHEASRVVCLLATEGAPVREGQEVPLLEEA